MTVQRSHGRPYPLVSPLDELPVGKASPEPKPQALPRPPYAAGSAEAREAGRRGGKRKAGTTALASRAGLAKTFADPTFERYRNAAEAFAKLHVKRLAEAVGGGECGPAPSSIVWSAGLQLAASRWAFEVAGDPALGSKLANDSRQNLLAAHELCAKEAASRPRRPHEVPSWLRPTPPRAASALPPPSLRSAESREPLQGQPEALAGQSVVSASNLLELDE